MKIKDKPQGKEWIDFIELWDKEKKRTAFAKRYGVSVKTIQNWVAEHKKDEIQYVAYPNFHITPFISHGLRDAESMVINLTDHHIARLTESYNLDIHAERLDTLLHKVMRIVELHSPIKKIYINMLGDMAQGENVYQGSKVESVEVGVSRQINEFAIPRLSGFAVSLLQVVPEVEIHVVPGNHGRYAKEAPDTTNWDIFIGHGLSMALDKQPEIKVVCNGKFYDIVTVEGFRLMIFHGNQVKASQGIPLFALKRRCQEWYASFGDIYQFICGHWHCLSEDQVNQKAQVIICPPLVTGDSWALEKVGRATAPMQVVFGMHEKQGRTWTYPLLADDKFIPKKVSVTI